MKKILAILLLVLLTGQAFAESKISSTWAKSYYKDNDINLYASVGYLGYLCVGLHGEWIISEFPIPQCPLDFGVMVNVGYNLASAGGVTAHGIGIAPTFNVHLGLKNVPIEFFVGLGLGYAIAISGSATAGQLIFANVDGFVWHFSDMFGLFVEFSWFGTIAWGAGIQVAL